jgi:hypothetical protein
MYFIIGDIGKSSSWYERKSYLIGNRIFIGKANMLMKANESGCVSYSEIGGFYGFSCCCSMKLEECKD